MTNCRPLEAPGRLLTTKGWAVSRAGDSPGAAWRILFEVTVAADTQ
jgi:hypothetical protein